MSRGRPDRSRAPGTTATRALRALGRDPESAVSPLAGSASGSGVYAVDIDGIDAVLKVTAADDQQDLARRELEFYRTLAGTVPVTTPELLDGADTGELTVLLLAARGNRRPVVEWRATDWLRAARLLADLHSTVVGEPERWRRSGRSWLERCLAAPPTREVTEYWNGTPAAEAAGRCLSDVDALGRAIAAVPECLVHGDCHADNLLLDDADLVWIDWQGVHIGNPAGDLSFLWSRANADGADPPREAMLAEYLAHRSVEPVLMRRGLIASELGSSLYGWPEYARYHTAGELGRIDRRVIELEQEWRDASNG